MQDSNDRRRSLGSLGALAAGLALFAVAALVARGVLPEWRAGEIPPAARFAERARELAADAGVDLAGGEIRLGLDRGVQAGPATPYATLGAEAGEWLLTERRPLFVLAVATGTTARGVPVFMLAHLGLDGRPWNVSITRSSVSGLFTPRWEVPLPTPETILLRPGERLGEPVDTIYHGNAARLYRVIPSEAGTGPPQFVAEATLEKSPATFVGRGVGEVEAVRSAPVGGWYARTVGKAAATGLLFLGVVVLAFVLAIRRRIDFVNGAVLAVVATGASVAAAVARPAVSFEWIEQVLRVGFGGVFLFLLWASAESLRRDAGGEPTNALDLLRRGRVDRRVGRAAVWGLGVGAAVAAVSLLAYALPAVGGPLAEAFLPARGSVPLPLFEPGRTPFDRGIRLAGETLLVLAAAHRLLPRRWVLPAAVVLAAVVRVLSSWELGTLWAELAVALAVVALLVVAYRRAGSLALLVAGISAYLFPAVAFSALHPAWLGGSLVAAGLALVAFGAVGLVGIARPEREPRPVEAPAFLARIEEERRVRYEMDLLARMQLGLLPEAVPEVPGWQVAARSMLAHEVGGDFYDFLRDEEGRLWIAAGDVAGHGSFCSISHAMTKAALASLVAAERTPGRVLADADRVLRRLGERRIFTSLALLRLDPASGRALLANAGYPFPLVRRGRRVSGDGEPVGDGDGDGVREIDLPGLPLGQGPSRHYTDVPLELAPGDALVLTSDGLFEARDAGGTPYGYERLRAGLSAARAGSADELLDALLVHWRSAVGTGTLEDDTTVVVLRREG